MSRRLDPVTLQVLVGALRAACEEMGAVLVRAAHSANIKERRDCSTALFDAAGELVMQAEHIPVHLGSMPDAVAAVLDEEQRPGDAWILNDPYRGGTHLPDITLISPVFAPGASSLLGFAASRAHHADVGGPTPAGMPADSTRLEDEGVVIPPTRADDERLARLAAEMRNPRQRLADLRAQRAANLTGERRLLELAGRHGIAVLRSGMAEILDYAERRTRARSPSCPTAPTRRRTLMEADAAGRAARRPPAGHRADRGRPADARLHRHRPPGRGQPQLPAAGDEVGRLLRRPRAHRPRRAALGRRLPPGRGDRARGMPAERPPAGRRRRRQRRDLEPGRRPGDRGARRRHAGTRPGPGDDEQPDPGRTTGFTYYETLGGGQGACPDADGPSAVHVAMSNTLNTPTEALETEFPLRVTELSVRRGSGGAGRHRGGDGIVRELEALAPMSFTLITERRRHAPRGRDGGADGEPGRNLLNGEPLPSKAAGELRPGDRLRIETPGGGGYGRGREPRAVLGK